MNAPEVCSGLAEQCEVSAWARICRPPSLQRLSLACSSLQQSWQKSSGRSTGRTGKRHHCPLAKRQHFPFRKILLKPLILGKPPLQAESSAALSQGKAGRSLILFLARRIWSSHYGPAHAMVSDRLLEVQMTRHLRGIGRTHASRHAQQPLTRRRRCEDACDPLHFQAVQGVWMVCRATHFKERNFYRLDHLHRLYGQTGRISERGQSHEVRQSARSQQALNRSGHRSHHRQKTSSGCPWLGRHGLWLARLPSLVDRKLLGTSPNLRSHR